MRKLLLFSAIALIVLGAGAVLTLNLWIKSDVKANIHLAQKKYPGTPEEALIAFLQDGNNSKVDRTHKAIWTLGQIESDLSLSILKDYYKGDPTGETCYGQHDQMLCQYEIYKAIQSIEKGKLFSYSHLK